MISGNYGSFLNDFNNSLYKRRADTEPEGQPDLKRLRSEEAPKLPAEVWCKILTSDSIDDNDLANVALVSRHLEFATKLVWQNKKPRGTEGNYSHLTWENRKPIPVMEWGASQSKRNPYRYNHLLTRILFGIGRPYTMTKIDKILNILKGFPEFREYFESQQETCYKFRGKYSNSLCKIALNNDACGGEQMLMAQMLYKEKNYEESIKFFERAMAKNCPYASFLAVYTLFDQDSVSGRANVQHYSFQDAEKKNYMALELFLELKNGIIEEEEEHIDFLELLVKKYPYPPILIELGCKYSAIEGLASEGEKLIDEGIKKYGNYQPEEIYKQYDGRDISRYSRRYFTMATEAMMRLHKYQKADAIITTIANHNDVAHELSDLGLFKLLDYAFLKSKVEKWEEAYKVYTSVPEHLFSDGDKLNYAFVKQKLEEIKKQAQMEVEKK